MRADELSTGMNVVIENCRSIDRASISIDPGKLNVKFAPNGTGKSSIAKALVAAAGGFDESSLAPFKWLQGGCLGEHPFFVDGLEEVSSVEVFDENYVQSVVFQQEDLFPGSFETFVRTPEFVSTECELNNQLNSLVELAEREDVRKLATDLEAFLADLIGGSGLDRDNKPKGTSPVVKALGEGNTWEHEGPALASFKPMFRQGSFKKWVSWHKQGGEYFSLMDGVCPYCGQSALAARECIDAVGVSFASAKVGNIEKIIDALSIGSAYMDKAAAEKLNAIVNSVEPITDQAKGFVGKVAQDAQLIIDALAKLRTVSSYFELSKADDLDARLGNCRLDIELVDSFKSATCSELATEINRVVEAAMANTGKLKGLVNRQKSSLARSLKGRCEEINAFLAAAGYPYTVDIPSAEDGKCSVRLVHTSSWEVFNSRAALSYGEKNAFALVFFAYECMRKEPDLVILDDPISSFDGAKRYALLSMLFLGGIGEATLKGRTVLLLTHDYGTLFDIEYTHKSAFQPSAKSCVLSCANGVVTETTVGADDMVFAGALYENLAKCSDSLVVKLVYARKMLEMRKGKGDAFDVVSSLFHHRAHPVFRDKSLMSEAAVSNGVADLEAIVGETVDYAMLLEMIGNPLKMLALFDDADANFEKLQIARIATDAKTKDKVLKERMDYSVHVGNGSLYQLDPTKFELVSSQLVERCREELLAMEKRGEGGCSTLL